MRFGLQTSLCNLCREVYNETKAGCFLSVFAVALLAEGVDRNVYELNHSQSVYQSPSSRRAWIEIFTPKLREKAEKVALLAEGVDRNNSGVVQIFSTRVALLAEGVDRNRS